MKKTQYKGGGEGVKGGLHCDLFLRNTKNVKIENGLNPGVTYFNGIWSSRWKESWEGLLVVTN